jgi:AmmeMemoRadiSam system protein B
MLRDPLQLSDRMLMVPRPLAPVLALCDGAREDAGALAAALAIRFGIRVNPDVIDNLLTALDDTLLLDNERAVEAQARALSEYRSAPFRAPALAGKSYPLDPDDLRAMLNGYLDLVGDEPDDPPVMPAGIPLGLVSPHIDYARGGPVYAQVWKCAAEAVRSTDLVVIFGTDHFGADRSVTLTRQSYATPFGVLPTPVHVVDAMVEALGEEAAFEGELRHRGEHSIELAAVWLSHIRQGVPCEVVPILCGAFHSFIDGRADAATDTMIDGLLTALKRATAGRRVFVVAAADLAHVGPAFGGPPLDLGGRARLKEADDELIAHMCSADAESFLSAIKQVEDRNNVCGVSPIYFALRAMNNARGDYVAYDRCPADDFGTSVVSVCGVTFHPVE